MPDGVAVEVVYALPEAQYVERLSLPAGATVADALDAVRGRPPFDTLALEQMPAGIFGDRVERGRCLQPGDRVEVYRELIIDPREARRRRAAQGRDGA
ncbi:MAG: RnfH family protein [Gammaproteobacteria bacterium]|nr:RnfH family protein [Gammaproteobacteria bacterium]